MNRLSLYKIIVHFVLMVLIVATMLLGYGKHKRELEDLRLVEKYATRMQGLCELYGIEMQVTTYEDLLKAFEEIVKNNATLD